MRINHFIYYNFLFYCRGTALNNFNSSDNEGSYDKIRSLEIDINDDDDDDDIDLDVSVSDSDDEDRENSAETKKSTSMSPELTSKSKLDDSKSVKSEPCDLSVGAEHTTDSGSALKVKSENCSPIASTTSEVSPNHSTKSGSSSSFVSPTHPGNLSGLSQAFAAQNENLKRELFSLYSAHLNSQNSGMQSNFPGLHSSASPMHLANLPPSSLGSAAAHQQRLLVPPAQFFLQAQLAAAGRLSSSHTAGVVPHSFLNPASQSLMRTNQFLLSSALNSSQQIKPTTSTGALNTTSSVSNSPVSSATIATSLVATSATTNSTTKSTVFSPVRLCNIKDSKWSRAPEILEF